MPTSSFKHAKPFRRSQRRLHNQSKERSLLPDILLLQYTYHIITGGAKCIRATHIHCSVIQFVQGSNVVTAFHLQQDPAERMPRSELC